jgi:hypothetical protein
MKDKPDQTTRVSSPRNEQLVREMFEHRERTVTALAEATRYFYEHRDEVRAALTQHREDVREAIAQHREAVRDAASAHADKLEAIITSRTRRLAWGLGLAAAAVLGLAWLIFNSTRGAVLARLDDEFSAPRVHGVIEDVAQRMVTVQLKARMEEAKALVDEARATTETAIESLRRLQNVIDLQGQAASLSRSAYDRLHELARTSPDATERAFAKGGYLMVDGALAFTRFAGDPQTTVGGKSAKVSELDSDTLLTLLTVKGVTDGTDQDAWVRASAATVLGSRGDPRAVPVIAALIQPGAESNLIALKQELGALRQLVPEIGSSEGSGFEVGRALEWWAAHQGEYASASSTTTTLGK